jgi:hypothetical protein
MGLDVTTAGKLARVVTIRTGAGRHAFSVGADTEHGLAAAASHGVGAPGRH